MDLGLAGKIAVVAASSQGLGRAIAHELAAEGTSVRMCGRGEARLGQAAEQIAQATKARVVAVAADVSKRADIERLADEARAAFGHVDIVVTNSGGPAPGMFEATKPEAWQA